MHMQNSVQHTCTHTLHIKRKRTNKEKYNNVEATVNNKPNKNKEQAHLQESHLENVEAS